MDIEETKVIDGITCKVWQEEHNFWYIAIEHEDGTPFGQPHLKPYHELIVRGAVEKATALIWAKRAIKALKDGNILLHDPEGLIKLFKRKGWEVQGEEWKGKP